MPFGPCREARRCRTLGTRSEPEETALEGMWIAPNTVEVTVLQGVVTLRGQLEQPAEVEVLRWMAGQVDGVVAVVDQLTWRQEGRRPRLSGHDQDPLHL